MAEQVNPNPLTCGCDLVFGRQLTYGGIRAHFQHIEDALEHAGACVLFLELMKVVNKDEAMREPLSDLRIKLVDLAVVYQAFVRPRLNEKFPPNAIADALGL